MKNRNFPGTRTLSVQITDFEGMRGDIDENAMPIRYAKEVLNLDASGGTLKPGLGTNIVGAPFALNFDLRARELGQVEWGTCYMCKTPLGTRDDWIIVYKNGTLYAISLFFSLINKVLYTGLSKPPVAVNYNLNGEDVIIFCGEDCPMLIWNGGDEVREIEDAPKISSMVVHYERLFATSAGTTKNIVYFSDDLDPTNWNVGLYEGGFIKFDDEFGRPLKVLSFLDYVYVFREFGISKISGYGDQTEFSVSHVATVTGRIYKDTVTLCGDVVFFMAEDGVYSFNGISINKILPELKNYISGVDNASATAGSANGCWYLSAKLLLENDLGVIEETPTLIEYNVDTHKMCVSKKLNILQLFEVRTEVGARVFAICQHDFNLGRVVEVTKDGKFCSISGLDGIWRSGWTTLGRPGELKTIKRISVRSANSESSIIIETESQKQTILVPASKTPTTRSVSVRGNLFRFSIITSATQANFSDLMLEIDVKSQ